MQYGNSNSGRLPELRARLRELQGNMSVTDFADKLGLSRQTVGFYLNGNRIPDSETLIQICNACQVSADWLLGIEKEPLGLSAKAINNISNIASDPDCLNSLNMILESSSMLRLLDNLKTIPKAIAAESEYIKRISAPGKAGAYIESKDDPGNKVYVSELGTLGLAIASEIVSNDLAGELISAHPELKDRIIVIHGYDAIERYIDDLGSRFAFLLKNETGFNDLTNMRFNLAMEQSEQRIGVDNGND